MEAVSGALRITLPPRTRGGGILACARAIAPRPRGVILAHHRRPAGERNLGQRGSGVL